MQFGWAIGGQEDHRHTVDVGFGHSRQEVRDSRSGRRDHERRSTELTGDTERMEAGRPLIDLHDDLHIGMIGCSHGRRRRPRPGGHDGMPHSIPGQFIDDNPSRGDGGIGLAHVRSSAASRRRRMRRNSVSRSAAHSSRSSSSGVTSRTLISPSTGTSGSVVTSPSSRIPVARPQA